MTNTKRPRVAQPGDTFILLVPSAQELHHLHRKQNEFRNQYGGQLIDHIHITSERFSPKRTTSPKECSAVLRHHIGSLEPFPVFSWRIQDTAAWLDFRNLLTKTLKGVGCPSHFDRHRRATCSILALDDPVNLSEKHNGANNSQKLFTAKEVVISRLQKNYQFEIIETIQLSGSKSI